MPSTVHHLARAATVAAITCAAATPAQASWNPRAYTLFGQPFDPEVFPLTIVATGDLPDGVERAWLEEAIEASIASWNAVDCADIELRYGGFVDTPQPEQVPVSFADPETEPCFSGNFIGLTVYNCTPRPTVRVFLDSTDSRWRPRPAPLEARVLNGRVVPAALDLTSVITHELGHVLGLGHSADDAGATMVADYLVDGGQASLAADDVLGLCALYPAADRRSACSSDAACPAGSACRLDGEFGRCDEYRAPELSYCSVDLLHCAEACLWSSPETGTGYCTRSCADDDDCDSGTRCSPQGDGSRLCALDPPLAATGCHHGQVPQPAAPLWWILGLGLWIRAPRRRARSRSASASPCCANP